MIWEAPSETLCFLSPRWIKSTRQVESFCEEDDEHRCEAAPEGPPISVRGEDVQLEDLVQAETTPVLSTLELSAICRLDLDGLLPILSGLG